MSQESKKKIQKKVLVVVQGLFLPLGKDMQKSPKPVHQFLSEWVVYGPIDIPYMICGFFSVIT